MKVKRLVIDALLAAVCVVLGYFSLEFGENFKFTFENLPVIIGAMMFGPIDGMVIGAVGTFLYQLLKFGLDPTTVLWILPYVISGLFVGLVAHFAKYNLKVWQTIILLAVNGLLVTGLNLISLYISYKYVWNMPTATLLATLPIKILISTIKAVAYAFLVPLLIAGLKKAKIYTEPRKKAAKAV